MEPLNKLKIEVVKDGKLTQVPALNIGFALKRSFVVYTLPPVGLDVEEQFLASHQELWLDRMKMIQEDLELLLRLPHHRFWSQVVFDEGLEHCLVSFLQNALRSHDLHCFSLTQPMINLQNTVYRLVFLVYLRIGTVKESEEHYWTPVAYGKAIYDYYIFDIPKIFDLCSLYSKANKLLLQEILANVFGNQPLYENDLKAAVGTILQTLGTIEGKLGIIGDDNGKESRLLVLDLPSQPGNVLTWKGLLDITMYLVDMWITLCHFLDVYSQAAYIFHTQGFAGRIASFYDNIVSHLIDEFSSRCSLLDVESTVDEAKKRLSFARVYMIKLFRKIIDVCCFQPILEKSETRTVDDCADDFLQLITAILPETRFLFDYCQRHSFNDDVEQLKRSGVELDVHRLNFIRKAITSNQKLHRNSSKNHDRNSSVADVGRSKQLPLDDVKMADGRDCFENGESSGSTFSNENATGNDLCQLISSVKDVLPHLGDGFIQACLEYYSFECEKVINAVLENNLPPSLDLENKEILLESEKVPSNYGMLSERRNVFDNDEFDVFSRDNVDISKVRFGKFKTKHTSADKQTRNITRELARKLECDVQDSGNEQYLYDDEYDDTYDEQMVGKAEMTCFDEFTERRPFVVPRVLAGINQDSESGDTSSEETEIVKEEKVNFNNFCENPAVIRERAEQQRQNQTRIFTHSRNYRGNSKGHGQSDAVLQNRAHKERNKAGHANHSRRRMADHKKAKGMIPI